MKSDAVSSAFAYPAMKTADTKKKQAKLKKAQLSFATGSKARAEAKAKADAKKAKAAGGADGAMDVEKADEKKDDAMDEDKADTKMDDKKDDKDGKTEEEEEEAEEEEEEEEVVAVKVTDFAMLSNPCRVIAPQEEHIVWQQSSRYSPVTQGRPVGIVMVSDATPDEEQVLVEKAAVTSIAASGPDPDADEGDEPDPPTPFEYDEALEAELEAAEIRVHADPCCDVLL